jgi:hypothetical protein
MKGNGFKISRATYTVALFSAATFSYFSLGIQTETGCACPTMINKTSQLSCQRAANESWMSWLTGNSRSSQFHYLDLLELLSRDNDKAAWKTVILNAN